MSEHRPSFDDFGDVEKLIKSAGDYVQVSRDLRPKTMELARVLRHEASAKNHVFCVVAMLLGTLVVANHWGHVLGGRATTISSDVLEIRSTADLFLLAHNRDESTIRSTSWELVDAFNEMRSRRTRVFNPGRVEQKAQ